MIGPPSVPPNWSRRNPSSRRLPSGPMAAKALVAFSRWSRMNSNTSPWKMLVPDLVTALTAAAE
jgi:hypothetical protein